MANPQVFDFFWLEENKISGSSLPSSISDIEFLYNHGIKQVISAESPTMVKDLITKANIDIDHLSLPIKDFTVPSKAQIKVFVYHIQK